MGVPRLRPSHLAWSHLRRSTISREQQDQSSRRNATDAKRQSDIYTDPPTNPHVQHLRARVLRPDRPHQPPPGTQIDSASSLLMSWSSSTTNYEGRTALLNRTLYGVGCSRSQLYLSNLQGININYANKIFSRSLSTATFFIPAWVSRHDCFLSDANYFTGFSKSNHKIVVAQYPTRTKFICLLIP